MPAPNFKTELAAAPADVPTAVFPALIAVLAAAFVAAWDNIVLFYVVVRPGLPVRLLLSEDFVLVLFLLKAE